MTRKHKLLIPLTRSELELVIAALDIVSPDRIIDCQRRDRLLNRLNEIQLIESTGKQLLKEFNRDLEQA